MSVSPIPPHLMAERLRDDDLSAEERATLLLHLRRDAGYEQALLEELRDQTLFAAQGRTSDPRQIVALIRQLHAGEEALINTVREQLTPATGLVQFTPPSDRFSIWRRYALAAALCLSIGGAMVGVGLKEAEAHAQPGAIITATVATSVSLRDGSHVQLDPGARFVVDAQASGGQLLEGTATLYLADAATRIDTPLLTISGQRAVVHLVHSPEQGSRLRLQAGMGTAGSHNGRERELRPGQQLCWLSPLALAKAP